MYNCDYHDLVFYAMFRQFFKVKRRNQRSSCWAHLQMMHSCWKRNVFSFQSKDSRIDSGIWTPKGVRPLLRTGPFRPCRSFWVHVFKYSLCQVYNLHCFSRVMGRPQALEWLHLLLGPIVLHTVECLRIRFSVLEGWLDFSILI